MALPNPAPKATQTQFYFARNPEDVYEDEALEGVIRSHRQMLELALRDFRDGEAIEDDWLEWLLENDITRPFSFVYCCEELGFDPGVIRTRTATYLYRYGNLTERQKKRIEIEFF